LSERGNNKQHCEKVTVHGIRGRGEEKKNAGSEIRSNGKELRRWRKEGGRHLIKSGGRKRI